MSDTAPVFFGDLAMKKIIVLDAQEVLAAVLEYALRKRLFPKEKEMSARFVEMGGDLTGEVEVSEYALPDAPAQVSP